MKFQLYLSIILIAIPAYILAQIKPTDLQFTRQASKRIVFDHNQSIPLASLNPTKTIGFSIMHPSKHLGANQANINLQDGLLHITSEKKSESLIWLSGFNPFASYSIDLANVQGSGKIGFQFASPNEHEQFRIQISYRNAQITDVEYELKTEDKKLKKSILLQANKTSALKGKIILQMMGSGLNLYQQMEDLPVVIAQLDFAEQIDLREVSRIQTFQSSLYSMQESGSISIKQVDVDLNAGMGLADIRPLTYENGDPLLDQGRLWFSMSIRGRGLAHPMQGIFSMNPSVFDIKFEGIVVFDRGDGLWRNEVASHLIYDRNDSLWKGITTGFSAYALPTEKKQLLAVQSKKDPRFGFSIMQAKPMGQVGDIEDPHILYDEQAKKWRILTCENIDGYKAIMLESNSWDKDYRKIAGPVLHNSTGTSIQKIDGQFYCFSGSSERDIFIYSYPDLKELGKLQMDLPPWDQESNTRVWPNVIELPDGYPAKYMALMMDRINYPGIQGPQWTYGALYLYFGFLPQSK